MTHLGRLSLFTEKPRERLHGIVSSVILCGELNQQNHETRPLGGSAVLQSGQPCDGENGVALHGGKSAVTGRCAGRNGVQAPSLTASRRGMAGDGLSLIHPHGLLRKGALILSCSLGFWVLPVLASDATLAAPDFAGQDLVAYLQRADEANPGLRAFRGPLRSLDAADSRAGSLPDPRIQFTSFVESVQTRTGYPGKRDHAGPDGPLVREARPAESRCVLGGRSALVRLSGAATGARPCRFLRVF